MRIGMIGLGRMGANMARRLQRHGHDCVVFDANPKNVAELRGEGFTGAASLGEFALLLSPPRHVWLMVPAGEATEAVVNSLSSVLQPGDTIIDGGNTYFKDDVRRAKTLQPLGLHYVDVGTSGGVWGLERGYCLMIGGDVDPVRRLEPIFSALAPGGTGATTAERGYLHCGPHGAGHYVKMVHNGIEYGLMQAYAEGFDLFRSAGGSNAPPDGRYEFDLSAIAELWRHGSVVSSWLLDLLARALAASPDLAEFSGFVQDSGEGRWTVQTAVETAVPVEVLSAALFARFRSRQEHTFAEKVLSALRHQFGGHAEPPRTTPGETGK
jgi:6-phosphogluconate dehydrogenase